MAGNHGIGIASTALINKTADGVSLADLWAEVQEVISLYDAEKDVLTGLLTYRTTSPADAVPQSLSPQLMEEASEFGVPRSIRPDLPYLKVGYTFKDYDLRSTLTARMIRDSTAEQVRAVIVRMIEADRHTIQSAVLKRIFSPAEETNDWQHRVFGAYNGTDGIKPPDFMGRSFDATHSHYIATGSTDLDSEDFELACKHVTEHGFGLGAGRGQLVAMFNPEDVEDSALTSWRAGVTNANSKKARYDFIVSGNAPAYLTAEHRVGAAPPEDIDGVPVLGSYGSALVVQSNVIPAGYFAIASTHGVNHSDNAIAFREHPDADWRGLRFIEGNVSRDYPLVNTFSMRSFGTGVRRRGAFVVGQLTAGSYAAPIDFTL